MELPYKHKCAVCGSEWTSSEPKSSCNECAMSALFVQLPPEAIAEADQWIFQERPLMTVQSYKSAIPIGLGDAHDLYYWRKAHLLKYFPEKFHNASPDWE